MSGVAGAVIGLASGAQSNIAAAQALVDGTTSARGCTTNFIGFGLGETSEEPLPVDFNATDDTVTLAITGGSAYAPTYTAVVGHVDRETLSWEDTTP
jgi:hypothetical protein